MFETILYLGNFNMKNKISLLSALALVTAQVGAPASAIERDATTIFLQCDYFYSISDRILLQNELGILLALDPNNECIDVIVQMLGGSPNALIPVAAY